MSDQRSAAAVATVRRQDTLHVATRRLAVSAWRCYSAVLAPRGGCGREVAPTPWWPHSKATGQWETCGPIAPSISVGRKGGQDPPSRPHKPTHTSLAHAHGQGMTLVAYARRSHHQRLWRPHSRSPLIVW